MKAIVHQGEGLDAAVLLSEGVEAMRYLDSVGQMGNAVSDIAT